MKERLSRGLEFALGATALIWALAASIVSGRSAHGITGRFGLFAAEPLLAALFLIFLLVFGFQLLDWIATRRGEFREALPLPGRAGWPREWALGAALGWGASLVSVLPVLLTGNLHGHWPAGLAWFPNLLLSAVTLLAVSLAGELIFRGYVFLRWSAALGPSWAALCTSLLFAGVLVWSNGPANLLMGIFGSVLFGLLLAIAYLRTQALWVSWGLHFAYRSVMLLLIGLPSAGRASYASVLDTYATGPLWLTGGGFGLDAALLTIPVLLGAIVILYRCTRDYAWQYTYRPIVGAGYEVAVAPPKAHTAMEQQAAKASPLVQILSTTSTSPTVPPPPPVP